MSTLKDGDGEGDFGGRSSFRWEERANKGTGDEAGVIHSTGQCVLYSKIHAPYMYCTVQAPYMYK
jgi:hypothetical protein